MLKGDRRLIKEMDMCRIIKDIKDLKAHDDKTKSKPVNILGSIMSGGGKMCKDHYINVDESSEEDAPLIAQLKKRLSIQL